MRTYLRRDVLAKGFVETRWNRLSIYPKANFAARLKFSAGPGSDAPPYNP